MSSVLVHAFTEKRVPGKVLLLWGGGLLTLFAFTFFGTLWGSGPLTLALFVACLVGGLILIRPEYGVLVLVSTLFLSYPELLKGSGRLTINNILGLILAGILLIKVALERRAEFLQSKQVQLFLLIGCAIVANQLLAEGTPPLESLAALDLTDKRLHSIVSKILFLIFLVAFIRTRWQILLLTCSVVLFVLMTAPNAIWNALTAVGGIEQIRASADFGISAAANANRLAFVAAMAIPLIAYGLPEFRSRAAAFLGCLAIALLVVTIFLSASRSGLISLLVLSAIFIGRITLRRGKLAPFLLLLIISIGISLAVIFQGDPATTPYPARETQGVLKPYLDRITNFFLIERGEEGAGSIRARQEVLGVGLRMFRDHPIAGVGIGNFRWVSVVDYQNTRPSAQHNSYLLTLVEGGLLLFIPYALLFWRTWKDLTLTRRLATQMPDLRLGWLVEAIRIIFVLFLIFSFFADIWHEMFPYFIVGLAAILTRLYRHEAEPVQP